MELSPKQLKANYDSIIALIEENIESPRKEQLLKLYDQLSEHMILAPASGNENYHLAFVGGYCIHVRNVVNASLLMAKIYKQLGGVIDFTKDELVFCALNHDLGKVGDGRQPYYIWNDSEWHRKNQGKMFSYNQNLTNMSITDRSLYLLQSAGITISENEWLAIKCSDGMYDESNKAYLKTYESGKEVKNNLVHIIHWSDHMSSRMEWDARRNDKLSDII
jgi:hypothetical protein